MMHEIRPLQLVYWVDAEASEAEAYVFRLLEVRAIECVGVVMIFLAEPTAVTAPSSKCAKMLT